MQVRLTAMKGQKVQELTKKENPNIFKQAFQIVTQFPYNVQNGMLYSWKNIKSADVTSKK